MAALQEKLKKDTQGKISRGKPHGYWKKVTKEDVERINNAWDAIQKVPRKEVRYIERFCWGLILSHGEKSIADEIISVYLHTSNDFEKNKYDSYMVFNTPIRIGMRSISLVFDFTYGNFSHIIMAFNAK